MDPSIDGRIPSAWRWLRARRDSAGRTFTRLIFVDMGMEEREGRADGVVIGLLHAFRRRKVLRGFPSRDGARG